MRCDHTPGCEGEIEDGYCNICGFPPQGPGPVQANPEISRASSLAAVPAGLVPSAGPVPPGLVPSAGPVPPAPPIAAGPQTLVSVPSTTFASGTVGSRTQGTRSSGSGPARGHLGAGLIEIPPLAYQDPMEALMADPQVPESKRFCGACGKQVGRTRSGRPGRADGHCPECGIGFSFTPKLAAGDLVAGQYHVEGCLAHGGMGWIYLARDRNVSDRWVVLKGLLDTGDESAMAAAIAERRFLAEVEHPNIVRIYNFVEHDGAGYIVMEYVGGRSLKELRQGPSGTTPLPAAQAIAYMVEALPALAYLHARGMLYCDFKPDNVLQIEEQIKIIDLGGVRRSDDLMSDLYGTIGYQAPEVADAGPSVASDLYTVARTLAVLTFDFRGFQDPKRFATSLPDDVPLFRRYPALHRFLLKGTDPDPVRRFQSAAEMGDQLVGVLRQVVGIDGGDPVPVPSRVFSAELGVDADQPTWRFLPIPAVDRFDAAAGLLASLAAAPPAQLIAALEAVEDSPDVSFQRARAHLELGQWDQAASIIVAQSLAYPEDWRVWWWQGIVELAEGSAAEARDQFTKVALELPGELAPVLAVGIAAEYLGDLGLAGDAYRLVAGTDPGCAAACFGLVRVMRATGDRGGAVTALRRVPGQSSAYPPAQAVLCSVLTESYEPAPTVEDLKTASDVLARLNGDAAVRAGLTRDLMLAALDLIETAPSSTAGVQLAGVPLEENAVRRALEQACRTLAKLSATPAERVALVDEANSYRPRTLL
jgi:serine/threonine-protein kinase PknG